MEDVSFIIKNKAGKLIEHLQAGDFEQWKHKNASKAIAIHLHNDRCTLIEHMDDIDLYLTSGMYEGFLVKRCSEHSDMIDLWKQI